MKKLVAISTFILFAIGAAPADSLSSAIIDSAILLFSLQEKSAAADSLAAGPDAAMTRTLQMKYDSLLLWPKFAAGGLRFFSGENRYTPGFFGGSLRKVVAVCPAAKVEMREYARSKAIGYVLVGIGFAVAAYPYYGHIDAQKTEGFGGMVTALGYLAAGEVVIGLGGAHFTNANNDALEAVRLYNRYLLFGKK